MTSSATAGPVEQPMTSRVGCRTHLLPRLTWRPSNWHRMWQPHTVLRVSEKNRSNFFVIVNYFSLTLMMCFGLNLGSTFQEEAVAAEATPDRAWRFV